MAETAILNASVQWDPALQDSIGPEYGWERLRGSQLATVKPAFGQPFTRTVGNGGHSTRFSWLNRSRLCVERLKQWAEQYERGFFTVVDQDGGGRHYVGNFVGDMPYSQAGNDRYNIQGWQFDEIPGCPMVQYPGDWARWSVALYPVDDYGRMDAATNSSARWLQAVAIAGHAPQLLNAAPVAGDWLTQEYRGYGFQLWCDRGPALGIVQLLVDGVQVATIDLYAAQAVGAQKVYEAVKMPLDVHRVKLVATATKNGAATASGVIFDRLQVMR